MSENINENKEYIHKFSKHDKIDGKISELRDAYLSCEFDYMIELLTNRKVYEQFLKYKEKSAEELAKIALELHSKIENGNLETPEEQEMMNNNMDPLERDEYHMSKLWIAEAELVLVLAGIKDKVLYKELEEEINCRKPDNFAYQYNIIPEAVKEKENANDDGYIFNSDLENSGYSSRR